MGIAEEQAALERVEAAIVQYDRDGGYCPPEWLVSDVKTMAKALRAAEAEIRRYRWLRDNFKQNTAQDVYGPGSLWQCAFYGADCNPALDAAIDAQLRKP